MHVMYDAHLRHFSSLVITMSHRLDYDALTIGFIPVIAFHMLRKKKSCYLLRIFNYFLLQKARLARIHIAKASSGAAFVSKKKAAEARLAAQESGLELEDNRDEDLFELQHHHLLRCLEKTTVSFARGADANLPHLPPLNSTTISYLS